MRWLALGLSGLALGAGFPAVARAGTVWVALPEEPGPCSFERLASLVAAERRDLTLQPGLHELTDRDSLVQLFRLDDKWTLWVRARGQRELVRSLPAPGADCVDLLQTSAFMVERYLDEVRWGSEDPTVVRPLARPDATPNPNAWHGVLELGVAAHLAAAGGNASAAPELRLDVGARSGPWLVELSGFVLLTQPGQPGTPSNTAQIQGLQVVGGRRFGLGPGTLRVELLLGADVAAQSAVPATAPDGSEQPVQTTPFFGARVGWEIPLYHRLFASLLVEGRAFYVGEDPPPWWLKPPFDGDASLGLGYVFF